MTITSAEGLEHFLSLQEDEIETLRDQAASIPKPKRIIELGEIAVDAINSLANDWKTFKVACLSEVNDGGGDGSGGGMAGGTP